jgi:hypothetical protein
MKLIKILITGIACCSFFVGHAQLVTLYPPAWYPESIVSDGTHLFVSSIGRQLDPAAKDGDGTISEFTLTGNLIRENVSKVTLNAPKGTAIIKKTLYVADLDRLIGIDLVSGKKVAVIDFSPFHTQFINDVSVKNDSTLFVSATDLDKVFQVTLGKQPHIEPLAIPPVKGANGLCFDTKTGRLYIAGLGAFTAASGEGEIGYITWKEGKPSYTIIPGIRGFFDGLALIDNNTLVVSDWVNLSKPEGVLKKVNINTGAAELVAEKIAGPADFYFDKKTNQLFIPVMQVGKMLKLALPPSGK